MEDLVVTIGRRDGKSGKTIVEDVQVVHGEEELAKFVMQTVMKNHSDHLKEFIQTMKAIEEHQLHGFTRGLRSEKDKLITLFNQVIQLKYSATTMPCYKPYKEETNELVALLNRIRDKILMILYNEMDASVVYKKCVTMNGERNSMYIDDVVFNDIKVCVDL